MSVLCGRSIHFYRLHQCTRAVLGSRNVLCASFGSQLWDNINTRNSRQTHTMSIESDHKFLQGLYDPAVKNLVKTLKLAKETGASKELIQSIEESLQLCRQRDQFADETTCKESDTCAKIMSETLTHDWKKVHAEKKTTWMCWPKMISGHVEGQFLKSFLSAQKAKRVLEVGMYTGYSAMSIAEALPADGQIVTLDLDEYLKELVQSLTKDSPHKHKIHIIVGDAMDSMNNLVKEQQMFDAIFLDAVKSDYEHYLKLCLDGNLLAPGGTILVDNAFFHGTGYTDPDCGSAKFANVIKNDPNLHVVLVPIRDGIFLIRRRVEVDGGVV